VITTLRPGRDSPSDSLASLEPAEVPVVGDPETARGVDVEAAGPLRLDVCVAQRLHSVLDGEGAHLEAVVLDPFPRPELDQLDLVAELAENPPQRLEEAMQPRRPDDPQGRLPLHQVVGLQQPRQPEVVVGVEVGDVDVVDLDQPGRVDHLPLGPLPRIDQDPATAGPDQHAGGSPPRRGHGAAGAEEDDREIHGPSVRSTASARRAPTPGSHLDLAPSRP